jgi:peptidoglycan/LPS O-acetylase OafA/YrhL
MAIPGRPDAAPSHRRLIELDVLRGLAALCVVLFHYSVRYPELYGDTTAPALVMTRGYLGVEFFFCISGFVIFMTLERTRRPMDFVVSRFSRLWPAYIAAILITFSLVTMFGLPGRQTTPAEALVNLTMIQELFHVPHVDAAYWSLQVELIFYAWMLLAFVTGQLKRIRTFLWAALVPPIGFYIAHRYFSADPSYLAGAFLLITYIPYFTIGIAAYNMYARRDSGYQDLLLMLAAVLVAWICLSATDGWLALSAALILWAVARGYLVYVARGPFLFLGTISYTLYLVHQNFGYIVIRSATQHGISTNIAILIAIALSICLAATLTWLIEKPAQAWLRGLYKRLSGSVIPAHSLPAANQHKV